MEGPEKMKNKKLTIVLGGNVGFYLWSMGTFSAIEKNLNCKIKRISYFKFSTSIKGVMIEFRICYNPTKDNNYKKRAELFALNEKEIIPPPSDEVAKKIKSRNILFLGLCGGLKGKKSEIFIPEEFNEIFFEDVYIKQEEILKIIPKNKIKIKNALKGEMSGKNAKVLTTNLTLMKDTIQDKKIEYLMMLGNNLSKNIDVVEKESYPIVKKFRNVNIGVMLMSSDILTIKRNVMKTGKFNPNKDVFNKNCSKAIKEMLKNLK